VRLYHFQRFVDRALEEGVEHGIRTEGRIMATVIPPDHTIAKGFLRPASPPVSDQGRRQAGRGDRRRGRENITTGRSSVTEPTSPSRRPAIPCGLID